MVEVEWSRRGLCLVGWVWVGYVGWLCGLVEVGGIGFGGVGIGFEV